MTDTVDRTHVSLWLHLQKMNRMRQGETREPWQYPGSAHMEPVTVPCDVEDIEEVMAELRRGE